MATATFKQTETDKEGGKKVHVECREGCLGPKTKYQATLILDFSKLDSSPHCAIPCHKFDLVFFPIAFPFHARVPDMSLYY